MANKYVRPTFSGTHDGTSWTTAWNGLGGINWNNVNAGDTIWVAGGAYSGPLSLEKSGANNTTGRIFVRRARADASECTGASGWSSGYDSLITQTNGSLWQWVGVQYVLVSGRTTEAGGTYGWKCNCPGYTGEDSIIDIDANAKYGTYEYIDTVGPGYVTYTGDSRSISASRGGNSNFLFSHIRQRRSTTGIYIGTSFSDAIFEYIDQADCSAVNSAAYHPNGLLAFAASNVVVRYSYFHTGDQGHGCGEGIFFEDRGGCSNWKIYGNVFRDQNAAWLKTIQLQASVSGLLVYNNTFCDNAVPCVYSNPGTATGTSATRNNLLYNTPAPDGFGTVSHNITAGSSAVFTDYAGENYRPVSTVGTGYPLGAEYATDPDGNTRGADGTWDVGAYEYDGGVTPPTGPIGLRVR